MSPPTTIEEGIMLPSVRPWGLPDTDDVKVLPTSDQVGLYLANIHQMAPHEHTSDKQACYSFIDPGRIKG